MRLSSILWCYFLALLIVGTSCQDHQFPASPGQQFRLKRSIESTLRFYSSTLYNYNTNGRVSSYVVRTGSSSLVENGPGFPITMSYNVQGQLVSAEGKSINNYPLSYSYEYDSNGNISLAKRYDDQNNLGNPALRYTYQLEYAGLKTPAKLTTTLFDSSGPTTSTQQYTYNNENITKIDYSNNPNQSLFTYGDKTNPFYGLITAEPNSNAFSKNLSIDSRYVDTYDVNGLLIKRIIPSGSPANTQNDIILTYEYEIY